jgi:hypothetical protein
MIFSNQSGMFFELAIVGYQFPDDSQNYWDSNWLKIHIAASDTAGTWQATDPCLTAFEVRQFLEWIVDHSHNFKARTDIYFTEPTLSFEILQSDRGIIHLRIFFELKFRPPWRASRSVGDRDCWLDFELTSHDITAAVESLQEQLSEFPQRVFR